MRNHQRHFQDSPAAAELKLVALAGLALLGACLAHQAEASPGSSVDGLAILEDVKKYDSCVVHAGFSFLYASAYPPKSMDEFKASCKSQSEAFKCIKDKTKGSTALLRRGLLTLVATRQRHHRRYCTNLESEQTKRLVQASTCLMEKRLSAMRAGDSYLAQSLAEIARRNYNDSAVELKQFCCTFFNYKKNFNEQVGDECASHKHMAEEVLAAIVPDDTTIVCEDDEKMAKICPKLESLGVKPDPNFKVQSGRSPAALGLYLIATLGESASEVPNV